MSLEENRSSGNGVDAASRIIELAAPSAGIRLWWCRLDASTDDAARCERSLSPAELARAARFGNERLRNRYVVGRGSLRVILGHELGVDPARVEIVRGTRGRPQLAGARRFDFNVSHTASVALVGILSDARIGVDVEHVDRAINIAGIARKFLAPGERSALASLAPDAARRHVLELWTCKEAMSKATGDALSAPFGAIDIELREGPRVRGGPMPYQPAAWSLHRAAVPPGYVATVAVWKAR